LTVQGSSSSGPGREGHWLPAACSQPPVRMDTELDDPTRRAVSPHQSAFLKSFDTRNTLCVTWCDITCGDSRFLALNLTPHWTILSHGTTGPLCSSKLYQEAPPLEQIHTGVLEAVQKEGSNTLSQTNEHTSERYPSPKRIISPEISPSGIDSEFQGLSTWLLAAEHTS
jgi:hypothetical protein